MGLDNRVLPRKLRKIGTVLYMANTYIDVNDKAKYECRKWIIRSIRKPRRTKQEIMCDFKHNVKIKIVNKVDGITYSKEQWNEEILSAYPEYVMTFDITGNMPDSIWTTELSAVKAEIKYIKSEIKSLKKFPCTSSLLPELTENELCLNVLEKRLKRLAKR